MKNQLASFAILYFVTINAVSAQKEQSFEYWEEKIHANESFDKMKATFTSENYELLNDKKYIPNSLIKVLSDGIRKVKFVNAGENYRATDVVRWRGQPTRQIMLLAKSESYLILTYKHGGRGHHHHIIWCELTDNKITDLWIGSVLLRDLYTLNDIISVTDIDPSELNTYCR